MAVGTDRVEGRYMAGTRPPRPTTAAFRVAGHAAVAMSWASGSRWSAVAGRGATGLVLWFTAPGTGRRFEACKPGA